MIVIFDDAENRALPLDPVTESRLRKIYEDAAKIRSETGSFVGTIVALLIGLGEEDEAMNEPVH